MTVSPKTIYEILGIMESCVLSPQEMVKELEVGFFPKKYLTASCEDRAFSAKLEATIVGLVAIAWPYRFVGHIDLKGKHYD